MLTHPVRVTFSPDISMREVEGTLKLAKLACESLYGSDRVELEAHAEIDHAAGVCRIETVSDVGRALSSIFHGYIRREFGAAAFVVQRPRGMNAREPAGAAL